MQIFYFVIRFFVTKLHTLGTRFYPTFPYPALVMKELINARVTGEANSDDPKTVVAKTVVNFCFSRLPFAVRPFGTGYALVVAENQPRHLTAITASAANPVTNPSDMWKNRSVAREAICIPNLQPSLDPKTKRSFHSKI